MKDEAERRILARIFHSDLEPKANIDRDRAATPTPSHPIFTEGDVKRIVRKVLDRIGDQEIKNDMIE